MITSACGIDSESVELFYLENTLNLIYPEHNSEIIAGTPISTGESELLLTWSDKSEFMDYQLHLTEIASSKTSIFESKSKEISIILKNGMSYKWFVSIPGTRNFSEVWSFNYIGARPSVPSPAIAVSPISGASISSTSTTVNLKWKTEGPNNDIIGYDLYFGKETSPPLLLSDLKETNTNDLPVEVGNQYFWKVVTKYADGNEAISNIFNFSVG